METPKYHFKDATEEDARSIGARMCRTDAEEAEIATGGSAYLACVTSYLETMDVGGPCKVCVINGRPEMIFGVKPSGLLSDTGIVWMLHTDAPSRWGLLFAKHSVEALKAVAAESGCGMLMNSVLKRNTQAVRWLGFLGARFEEPFTDRDGNEWIVFSILKEDINGRSSRAKLCPR